MDRLTIMGKNGVYGLAKVKENEQDVESPYPNTLKATFESWQRLAQYENSNLMPDEIAAMYAEVSNLKDQIKRKQLVKLLTQPHAFIFWINEKQEIEREWKYLGFLWQMNDGMALIYHGSKPFTFKIMFEEDIYLTEEAARTSLERK